MRLAEIEFHHEFDAFEGTESKFFACGGGSYVAANGVALGRIAEGVG